LEKKKELCEKAEALKDSTDWKTTAEVLSKLQKEWKTIGPVPKKYSEMIWKRFIGACDYFFDQKNKATSSQRSVEQENMVLKKEIIEKLNAINAQETPEEDADNTIRELMKEWNTIGHVPFKEKDKLYKQYHAIIVR
jgi:Zn-dependent M32 family carboxypeptidase